MAAKSLLLAALLVVVVSLAPCSAEADKQPPLALVAGVVPCSAGSSINVAAVPPFPNAVVHMVCGGRVMAGTKADERGAFTMNMGTVTSSLLAPLLGNQCKVVVVTPLAACNASLASVTGTLAAPVQLLGADSGSGGGGLGGLGGLIGLIGQIVGGLLGGILNIIPLPFSVV
ncbi:phylloplanin-like [Aegilops tauschii subsp. strangulata]|nr:phylloplanin-like [Aegilops tauschii subsp. strangulata]